MRPTHERVRELLHYDPETGVFTWRVACGGKRAGAEAGSVSGDYQQVGVDHHNYRSHQLAWFWMTGTWPEHEIDHIDGNGLNNRFANLRDGSGMNQRNQVDPRKHNTSGFRGVTRSNGRWLAQIWANGKQHNLGRYDTPEEASAAYWAAKAELHGVETYQGRLS